MRGFGGLMITYCHQGHDCASRNTGNQGQNHNDLVLGGRISKQREIADGEVRCSQLSVDDVLLFFTEGSCVQPVLLLRLHVMLLIYSLYHSRSGGRGRVVVIHAQVMVSLPCRR